MSNTTSGIHHLGLTVVDVHTTANFFCDTLGFSKVGGEPGYPAIFVSDGTATLTLWQASQPASVRSFDRKNAVGLHHLALRISDRETLEGLHRQLAEDDAVQVEFSPQPIGSSGNLHFICSIPGGLRLEFVAPQ